MESMLLPPESRDWSELPMDAFSVIFAKLGAIELLMGAGLVCHSWLHAAKLPHLWQCVEMVHHEALSLKEPIVMSEMARAAVDRSDGRLEAFEGQWFVNDGLLNYIRDRYVLNLVSAIVIKTEQEFLLFAGLYG